MLKLRQRICEKIQLMVELGKQILQNNTFKMGDNERPVMDFSISLSHDPKSFQKIYQKIF